MTDLTALIDRLDNALYYAEPRQTVKLRREVAEAIRDALAALPAPHVPKQEPAALDRQTMVRALVEALAKGKMPDGSDMDEYIEPVNQADCAALGIPWPEHPHDRGVFIRECQREIMAGVLADAVLAALPAPHVPKQEPSAAELVREYQREGCGTPCDHADPADCDCAALALAALPAPHVTKQEPSAAGRADGARPLPYDRDTLGRFVREAWVRWAETQPAPKPSWLVPYDDLAEPDKEADRRTGPLPGRWGDYLA